jgi:hypothetical protein
VGTRLGGVAACLKAFRLPIAAPDGDGQRTRHRPFGIAGDWHGAPASRVRVTSPAKVRGQFACIGFIHQLGAIPDPPEAPRRPRPPGVGPVLLASVEHSVSSPHDRAGATPSSSPELAERKSNEFHPTLDLFRDTAIIIKNARR